MAENNIVMQSKVTLSRNVSGYPFPHNLRDNRASVIAGSVYEAVCRSGNYELYKISQISEQKSRALVEQGLISDALATGENNGSAIISDDKTVSIMINEEDHIVEQCYESGLNLESAFQKIDKIDDLIAEKNKICFDDKLGYLTSGPANAGTGMHASVVLFLPALVLTKNVQKCANAVNRLGITMRSVDGEGAGYLYSLTNQRTLGLTEKEIIDLVKTATGHAVTAEEQARSLLKISSEVEIRDKASRSLGILKSAYRLTESEMISLVAWVKLGVSYGWVESDCEKLDKIVSKLTTAVMVENSGMTFATPVDRDVYRAEAVKAEIN